MFLRGETGSHCSGPMVEERRIAFTSSVFGQSSETNSVVETASGLVSGSLF